MSVLFTEIEEPQSFDGELHDECGYSHGINRVHPVAEISAEEWEDFIARPCHVCGVQIENVGDCYRRAYGGHGLRLVCNSRKCALEFLTYYGEE